MEFWDGSHIGSSGPERSARCTSRVPTPSDASCWCPNELGFGRAYVAGDLDADGDIYRVIEVLRDVTPDEMRAGITAAPAAVRAARKLGLFGKPLPPPPEEARLRGWRHSLRRDADAIGHHYDVGNDFYRLVLGPSMTYSCARFTGPTSTSPPPKRPSTTWCAVNSGSPSGAAADSWTSGAAGGRWRSTPRRSTTRRVVGITISEPQATSARERVAAAGVADRVEIRLQDYRELGSERFDAISSIGMSEHVGRSQLARYFEILHYALEPKGRLLNHAISSVGSSRIRRTSFIGRYVFPDGELIDIGDTVLAMERAGSRCATSSR